DDRQGPPVLARTQKRSYLYDERHELPQNWFLKDSGVGPMGLRSIQYVLAFFFRSRNASRPAALIANATVVTTTKYIAPSTTGLTTRFKAKPSANHARLRGASNFGRTADATAKKP